MLNRNDERTGRANPSYVLTPTASCRYPRAWSSFFSQRRACARTVFGAAPP